MDHRQEVKMKIRVMLLEDDNTQTGSCFEVENIPSKFIGVTVIDSLNKKLNGYGE